MNIIVSACLLGENCKYSGGSNDCKALHSLLEGHHVIPVCPEVIGGLPVPRSPAEIVNGVVMNQLGNSVDLEFRNGAEKAFQIALTQKADLAILQPRSPSCGTREIYDGTFQKHLIPGQGIFASMLMQAGIPMIEPDEAGEYLATNR